MMKAVPKIFKPFSLAILLFIPMITMAEFNPTLVTCSQINDDTQRLACFDLWVENNDAAAVDGMLKTSKPVKAKTQTTQVIASEATITTPVTKAPLIAKASLPEIASVPETKEQVVAATPTAIEPEQSVEQEFGLEHKKVNQAIAKNIQMEFVVAKSQKLGYGNLHLTFENGQVWKSISAERTKLKEGQHVIIKRGALNSFLLSKVGSNRTIRVKRLK